MLVVVTLQITVLSLRRKKCMYLKETTFPGSWSIRFRKIQMIIKHLMAGILTVHIKIK